MNDEWRRQLAAMNKGPLDLRVPRHAAWAQTIVLPGDFTGAVLTGQVRLYPDQPGAALVALSVAGPVVASGASTFTLSLTEAQLEALPAATLGEGDVGFVYDLLLDPAGAAAKELLFGGDFIVVGGSTNV